MHAILSTDFKYDDDFYLPTQATTFHHLTYIVFMISGQKFENFPIFEGLKKSVPVDIGGFTIFTLTHLQRRKRPCLISDCTPPAELNLFNAEHFFKGCQRVLGQVILDLSSAGVDDSVERALERIFDKIQIINE